MNTLTNRTQQLVDVAIGIQDPPQLDGPLVEATSPLMSGQHFTNREVADEAVAAMQLIGQIYDSTKLLGEPLARRTWGLILDAVGEIAYQLEETAQVDPDGGTENTAGTTRAEVDAALQARYQR